MGHHSHSTDVVFYHIFFQSLQCMTIVCICLAVAFIQIDIHIILYSAFSLNFITEYLNTIINCL